MENKWFVADDGEVYNAFSTDMFDENGWLIGYEGIEGYNFADFDIVRYCPSQEDAFFIAEKMNNNISICDYEEIL